jgi:SAM-dependent methyltransferase
MGSFARASSERKFDVIEHLPDPRNLLERIKEHLGPTGKIIVEVPSADDALLTLYESDPFSRFTYWSCHLYFFNAQTLFLLTLFLLAKQAGLRVRYITSATQSRITFTGYHEEIRAATIIGHFWAIQKWNRHTKIRWHELAK